MQTFTKAICCCIISVLALAACKKKDTKTDTPLSNKDLYVVVKNNTSKAINFLWKDTTTFGQIHSGLIRILPHETAKISYDNFKYYGVFYVYYSDDKYITNMKEIWESRGLKTVPNPDTSDFIVNIPDSPRVEYVKCLKVDGSGTEWKAIDAFDVYGKSMWNTLSINEQNQNLSTDTVSPYGAWWWPIFTYNGYLNGRNITTKNFPTKIGNGGFEISFLESYQVKFVIMDDCRPAAPLYTTSLDTMYMKVDSIPYYYKMYRIH